MYYVLCTCFHYLINQTIVNKLVIMCITTVPITNGMATVTVNGLQCEGVTYTILLHIVTLFSYEIMLFCYKRHSICANQICNTS